MRAILGFQIDKIFHVLPKMYMAAKSVRLENLTPEGAWFFELPRVALGFETHFDDGQVLHSANVSTVEIRPDDREVTMTFATHLPCHHREDRLRGTVITEKTIVPLGAPRRGRAR